MPSAVLSQTDDLGRYQVLRRLARGGMAEVLLARVKGLEGFEKLVVLKTILPELVANREFVEMFLDEARVLAQLQHTNIAQVYDMGATAGGYFISMEFLHGQDLRTLLRAVARSGTRLPLEHVLSIAAGVAAGLHYAHEKAGFDGRPMGIVHRDVSPHNVFVTYDGAVKLLDFGIAKTTRRASHTRAGTLKGKIGYMAPEQYRSEELDRRADIFAVGVLMWEMLAGQRLHDEASDFETMKAICEEDAPRPSTISPCDGDAERIIMKALARDRTARYQTAQELLEEIEELARERRLKLAAHELAVFVRDTFAPQIAGWESARREGKSLGDHMLDVTRADSHASARVAGIGFGAGLGLDPADFTPLAPPPAVPRATPVTPPSPAASPFAAGGSRSGRRRRVGMAAAVLVLALAGGAGLLASRHARSARDAAAGQTVAAAEAAIHHHDGAPAPAPPAPTTMTTTTPATVLGVQVVEPAAGTDEPAHNARPNRRARPVRANARRSAAAARSHHPRTARRVVLDADTLEVE